MDTVVLLIKKTRLFSDAEKIELLSRIPEISDTEKKTLVKIIRDFDEKVANAKKAFLEQIEKEVTSLKTLDAGKNKELAHAATQAITLGAQVVASGIV